MRTKIKKLFKKEKNNVILSETKNLMRSFTFVQDDNQSGRSMVEMLGVLAVMGVLSVGGVAMYTSAMNKYRANELLNEASKRAAIVTMQITSGKTGTGLSIAEFTQPSGYKFGVDTSYVAGGKTFNLTLSKDPSGNIDEAICNQMIAATGTNSAMQVAPGCGTITFNADMSKGVASGPTEETDSDDGEPGTYICENSDSCFCMNYNLTYPNCVSEGGPTCEDFGACYDGVCRIAGTYPNCNIPACLKAGACVCYSNADCFCLYGGTYPDACNERPTCIKAGTCYCDPTCPGCCWCKDESKTFPHC